MPGAPPSQAPLSENLNRTLGRVRSIAEEQHHGVTTPEHLVLALIDDPDAAPVMQACGVDLDKLRLALAASLSSKASSSKASASKASSSKASAVSGAAPIPDARFQAILQRTVVHEQRTGRNQKINGAHVLAAMLVSTPAEPAAEFLRDRGMTRFDALRYICHGLRKGEVMKGEVMKGEAMPAPEAGGPAAGAAMLHVKLLNDDYTPMEFVVEVLQRVFNHDRETATRTMLWIHGRGAARCGTYPSDIAKAKAAQVLEFARAHGHPLGCVTAAASRDSAALPPPPTAESDPAPPTRFSRALELTLHQALACANERQHAYTTLEHLLLALIDDADASAVLKACEVDLVVLKETLAAYIDNELKTLVTDDDRDTSPTSAFLGVVRRAVLHAQGLDRHTVTGADLLMAMLSEAESPAVRLLGEKASSIIPTKAPALDRGVEDDVVRQSFSHGRAKPVVVEKLKRRPGRR